MFKVKKLVCLILLIPLLFCSTSCTFFAKDRNKVQARELGYVKQNNQSIKTSSDIILTNIQKMQEKVFASNAPDAFTNLQNPLTEIYSADLVLSDFANRNNDLLGTDTNDIKPVDVYGLMHSNTIPVLENNIQIHKENAAIKEDKKLTDKLVVYGEKYEQQRDAKIAFYTKWISIFGGGLAAIVGIFVAFPPLLGMIPSLSSVFGVISKKAGSAIVTGIGNARSELKVKAETDNQAKLSNPSYVAPTYSASEALAIVDKNLDGSTKDHEKTINYLRDQNNV